MIIDKASKSMIELLNTSEPDWPRGVFSFDHICRISGLNEDDMFPIVKGLVRQGLAEYATFNGDRNMGIALTQSGKSYKELQRLEARERWRERLYGFISGIISGLLIAGIPQLISYLRR